MRRSAVAPVVAETAYPVVVVSCPRMLAESFLNETLGVPVSNSKIRGLEVFQHFQVLLQGTNVTESRPDHQQPQG